MNLIPVDYQGVSYGSEILTEAITLFRKQLLAVIISCPKKDCEYQGDTPTPDNIIRADINVAICLFREPGTIGRITGFIHEDGMNINISGTGGHYGKEFMDVLSLYDIQPWFIATEGIYEEMAERSGNINNFNISKLPLDERLRHWNKYLINVVYPRLYTESLGIFGGRRSGTWQKSWKSSDISEGYVDDNQLDAMLDNTDFHGTFLREISNLQALNSLQSRDQQTNRTLKRQLYVGVITCLETYLSDAFIHTILSNDSYTRSFISTFKDFEDQKFKMNELFDRVGKSREIAKTAMSNVIYHNIPKVNGMYRDALDISFPNFAEIQRSVITRHDLVHRNGKTKKGKNVEISKSVVEDVIIKVKQFVKEIDRQLKALNIES